MSWWKQLFLHSVTVCDSSQINALCMATVACVLMETADYYNAYYYNVFFYNAERQACFRPLNVVFQTFSA